MHWQQYTTLAVAAIAGMSCLISAVAAKTSDKASTNIWGLASVIAMQAVLWSGGWYGN